MISKTNSSISKLNICLLAEKMIPKTTLGIASLTSLVALIGYCIYFDYKRRSDPLFKRKLKEKRIKEKLDRKTTETTENPDEVSNQPTINSC